MDKNFEEMLNTRLNQNKQTDLKSFGSFEKELLNEVKKID